MPVAYPAILSGLTETSFDWSERDTLIYALGVGCGEDPLDTEELPLVVEGGIGALPSLAAAWALRAEPPGFRMIDYRQLLHAGQEVLIHRPLPRQGRIHVRAQILSIFDRGRGRGAMLTTEVTITEETRGERLATTLATALARADGGFGGPVGAPAALDAMPDRPPDDSLTFATRPNQALLYRLSGDLNPLHSNPAVARAAGFDRPILHGLCSFAITARAVTATYCGQDPARILSHRARFSAPVYPGEAIRISLWRDGDIVSFCADVPSRGVEVIRNGRSVLRRGGEALG